MGLMVRTFNDVIVNQDRFFRVVFSPVLHIECKACDEPVGWSEADKLWKCPDCENQITPAEALVLAVAARKAIQEFIFNMEGRGRLWRWIFR